MKIRIEADPSELLEKSDKAVEAVANRLGVEIDILHKALEREPLIPAMRSMHRKNRKAYKNLLDEMLQEINDVLED